MSWTAPGGTGTLTGYNVYRGTTSGGESGSPLNGATPWTSTTYSDTACVAGTTYYYKVKAVTASGSSLDSVEANALTYPAAPAGLGATAVSTTQINLTWTAPSGMVTGYYVYRGVTPGGESGTALNSLPISSPTYSDTTVSTGTTYYYTVEAVNGSGSSVASTEANALTIPAAPTGLSARAVSGSTAINLSWTAPSGTVSGYNIYRSSTSGGENYSGTLLNGSAPWNSTSYSDTTSSGNTTYYYTVEAVNTSGSGAPPARPVL